MQAYLLTDPLYAGKFRHVWLWQDFFVNSGKGQKGHHTLQQSYHDSEQAPTLRSSIVL